jgi:hypothetical protein
LLPISQWLAFEKLAQHRLRVHPEGHLPGFCSLASVSRDSLAITAWAWISATCFCTVLDFFFRLLFILKRVSVGSVEDLAAKT